MIKRKGQIFPKYLCRSIEKKAQHLVKFGCDVEITGKKIEMLSSGCAHRDTVSYPCTKEEKDRK